jgi:hypothetical protein
MRVNREYTDAQGVDKVHTNRVELNDEAYSVNLESDTQGKCTYRLRSIVCYINHAQPGDQSSGHYITYVRISEDQSWKNSKWVRCDDQEVSNAFLEVWIEIVEACMLTIYF